VPKVLWHSNRKSAADFPDWMVRNDAGFQEQEATSLISSLRELGADVSDGLKSQWLDWQSKPGNYGRPLDVFLDMGAAQVAKRAGSWAKKNAPSSRDPVSAYLASADSVEPLGWFAQLSQRSDFSKAWSRTQKNYDPS